MSSPPSIRPGPSANPELLIQNEQTRKILSLFSPMTLYSEATTIILDPLRKTTQSLLLMGPMERLSISRFQNPLPFTESIYIVFFNGLLHRISKNIDGDRFSPNMDILFVIFQIAILSFSFMEISIAFR
jgi:hypothetical protein